MTPRRARRAVRRAKRRRAILPHIAVAPARKRGEHRALLRVVRRREQRGDKASERLQTRGTVRHRHAARPRHSLSRHVAEASVVDNDARVCLAAVAVARQRLWEDVRLGHAQSRVARRRADGAGEAQHGGPQRVDAGVRVARQLAPHPRVIGEQPVPHGLIAADFVVAERLRVEDASPPRPPRAVACRERAHPRCAERERAAVDALRLVRNDQPARAVHFRDDAGVGARRRQELIGAQQPELVAEDAAAVAQHVGVGVDEHRRVDVGGQVRQQLQFLHAPLPAVVLSAGRYGNAVLPAQRSHHRAVSTADRAAKLRCRRVGLADDEDFANVAVVADKLKGPRRRAPELTEQI